MRTIPSRKGKGGPHLGPGPEAVPVLAPASRRSATSPTTYQTGNPIGSEESHATSVG
jgi:hypothetical protein